jgi:hypothetical protein
MSLRNSSNFFFKKNIMRKHQRLLPFSRAPFLHAYERTKKYFFKKEKFKHANTPSHANPHFAVIHNYQHL